MKRGFLICALICAILAALAIAVQSVRLARERAKNSQISAENEALRADLESANMEADKLRAIVERTKASLESVVERMEDATHGHVERMESIGRADPDWLVCPLPDVVREAFGAYGYAGDQAP